MDDTLVKVVNLAKWFESRGLLANPFKRKKYLKAVDGVSFNIMRGQMIGLVGESGCGKTTTGRLLLNLIQPTSGEVFYKGMNVYSKDKSMQKRIRREMQIVFQDPYESLSPLLTIQDLVAEPLTIQRICDRKDVPQRVEEALASVDLVPAKNFLKKYAYELSGGQRQRVAIARALILAPEFVVADEPISMIDVSLRIGIMDLMLDLNSEYHYACLFITHDISAARYVCEQMIVMYLGKIVETGLIDDLITEPAHPYTQALISNVPILETRTKHRPVKLRGTMHYYDGPGCRFHPRCPYAKEHCGQEEPEMIEVKKGHYAACHFAANNHN